MPSHFPVLILGIITIITSQVGIQHATEKISDPCDKTQSRISVDRINYWKKYCPGENDSNQKYGPSWFGNQPKGKDKNPPKFKVYDFDTCILGQETLLNCNSNPDIEACNDESYPIVRQISDLEGRLIRQFSFCPGDPETQEGQADQAEIIPVVTPDQFRSFPILGSKLHSEPKNFSLKNGHTHLWASRNLQTFNTVIGGSDIKIKAIPIQWNWKYGDGVSRNLDFPGQPEPEHTLHDKTDTSHIYKETGKFRVDVTTLYRGEFSVEGGPWQAIPGQATVPSTSIEIDVWRTKKELIANE
ncbi:hypothetical protein [Glutamicibacter protophormiae]|uniref:hypothetical protein n=1 Tax=Glutamicibacter protophormiae TaxID=37930 RepID=UPI00195630D7|nr:hypothetical protein [Glutamicibacter protophormiae]QRQ77106.1 hypothetical protein JQN66_08975 [Glutamicibacter protophormiae]